ncbi:NADH-quinone oxidoreductase subunit M [Georgenia sp. TF02-10]|uniref:NADH-quinone oxidoreductase subunit M n=1 Tax=Georgenia sp. TF02-10 TaxID=2917725 RepID=UPI001FA731FF|nr:NADH-quinone oxidoreductase subunit M [Georgenia sp. TF02-10]UNX54408.1 NADH-quinone oxidoreductase subunit M [Georgenia sp. TF02-10]
MQTLTTAAVPWLTVLIALPAVAALVLWLVPPLHRVARPVALGVSLVELALAVAATTAFDMGAAGTVQLGELHSWIPQLGVSYAVGVNGLGLALVLLAVFLVPLVLLAGWRDQETVAPGAVVERRQMGFVALVLALEAMMVAVFAARDVFLFYIVFEAMLVPVYFLVGSYGGPRRRTAALKFLLYSLAGGLIMLVGVVAVYLLGPGGPQGFLVDNLAGNLDVGPAVELALFLSFFIAFAIKAPMVPVHTWLPDTAQQAPPGASVLLVGVLDKVGTFGMIALCLPLFPGAAEAAAPVIVALALVSIIYGGLLAVGQRDIMRLIAYTSVSHFGFIVLGIFVRDQVALSGAMIYMVAHGVSIAALFLITGFLTTRAGTQHIPAFGGMQRVTPVLAGTFLVAGLATIALPGLSGFVPEYLVLLGSFRVSVVAGVVAVLGVIIAAVYVLLPYQRMFTGPKADRLVTVPDLGAREKWVVAPLVAAMLALGFYPAPVLDAVTPVAEGLAIDQPRSLTAEADGGTEADGARADGAAAVADPAGTAAADLPATAGTQEEK